MNPTAYIQSGAIESCVLGLATEAEQAELVVLCRQYREVQQTKLSFELALEAQLLKGAVAPPAWVRANVLDAIAQENRSNIVPGGKHTAPVLQLNRWKWIAAACFMAALVVLFWAYRLATTNKRLQMVNTELTNRLDHSNHTDALLALKPVIAKPSVVWSTMLEPENANHCAAHIYWDTLSANTYLLLGNIPSPLTGRQFQLWAITDARPVSLGLFDISKEGQLLPMKRVQNAKAFMITIEPQGGSAAPTPPKPYAVSRQL